MVGSDNSMRALIASWLDGGKIRRHSDYMERGRRYGRLADELLLRSWTISWQCSRTCPFDSDLTFEQTDLTSEIELRGISLPTTPAYDAYLALLDCENRGAFSPDRI